MKYKYSVLTFNFGDYDILREPVEVDPECEYVHITDDPNTKSDVWNVVYTNKFKDKDPIYASFYVRWHPFEFVHTDECIIMDCSIKIRKKLSKLVDEVFENGYEMGVIIQHYGKDRTYSKLNFWRDERNLSEEEYANSLAYIKENWNTEYRGYIEATVRVAKNDAINTKINKRIWEDCLKLGINGSPLRLDEIPFSIIMQTEFKNMKVMKFDRRLIQGDYMRFNWHKKEIPMILKLSYRRYGFYCNHKIKIKVLE